MVKNHNIINEYLELDELYKSQYETYLILLQVGSFYEMYSINPEEIKLKKICEELNIVLTKKNKTIKNISKSNPLMAGFPCHSLEKFLDILINNNYTVIVYDQYIEKNKTKRKLNKIYSIGTYIDSDKNLLNDNLILSLYIENINNKFITGISIINLSTGNVKVLELYNEDINKLIEDINKEFIIYNPKEVILSHAKNINNNIDKIITFFKSQNVILHYNNTFDNIIYDINYQNEFFYNIYKYQIQDTTITTIEFLDLEIYSHARLSLLLLLKFGYNHDNNIINYLNKPELIINKDILNLHNNALYQLNIISNNKNYKYNSLFDIINKTSTNLGKRFLKSNLTEPITNIEELNIRYNIISKLQNNNTYLKYEKDLNNIIDIEKYHKKLSINKLHPFQFARLFKSYKFCINIIKYAKLEFEFFNYDILDNFKLYYKELTTIFNIDNLEFYNHNTNNNNSNIFKTNIIKEIDELYEQLDKDFDTLNSIISKLSSFINNDKIELKYTDRDGYCLSLTKIRANKLKKALDNITISEDILQNIIFENKTQSNTYITSTLIKNLSKNITHYNEKVNNLIKKYFYEITNQLYDKYYICLNYLNYFISYIDFLKSNTKISILNNYYKPTIIKQDISFINCSEIRHPISEHIHSEYEYITNDIFANYNNTIGNLLYGSNGVGKSTLMKAVGLNIILAQIGCFVPSSKFEYMPYNNLFTRIDHSDNLFKGLSSFESEILELKTILNFSNKNSLVLGDEILNSTENISAISIISASINYFLNNNISFIFASHLHQIPDYIDINLKNNINICHLTMDYDPINQTFIYTRKLESGPLKQNYGLIVAKSLLNNDFIINSSLKIQNEILNKENNNKILNNSNKVDIKKSKYNSNLYMSKCYICSELNINKDPLNILETHHIIFQKNFENNKCKINEKNHIKKNQESNLVNLCKYHHLEVHNNNIIINKWIKTNNGRKLDYVII